MARVFEYNEKRVKYVKDMKMGGRWRVNGLGKKVRKPKKDSGTQTQELKVERKKRRRFHPGTVALWEIRKYQKSMCFLIRKLPFTRWVRGITKAQRDNLNFQVLALQALQETAEVYVVNLFEDANLCTIQEGNTNTQGHSAGPKDPRGYGYVSSRIRKLKKKTHIDII